MPKGLSICQLPLQVPPGWASHFTCLMWVFTHLFLFFPPDRMQTFLVEPPEQAWGASSGCLLLSLVVPILRCGWFTAPQ